jgi:hypothetical protein
MVAVALIVGAFLAVRTPAHQKAQLGRQQQQPQG